MPLNFSGANGGGMLAVDKFGGVDFSTQPAKVSLSRSPDAANMMMNQYGYIEKRTGYKRVYNSTNTTAGKINGIFTYRGEAYGDFDGVFRFIHDGTYLYSVTQGADHTLSKKETLFTDLADSPSSGFEMNGAFFILDGKRLLKLYWDVNVPCLMYGYVDDDAEKNLSTDPNTNCIIANRTPVSEEDFKAGLGVDGDIIRSFDMHNAYVVMKFKGNGKGHFKFCDEKSAVRFQIIRMYSTLDGTLNMGNTGSISNYYSTSTSRVINSEDIIFYLKVIHNFVYAPTIVVNRPAGLKTGAALEAVNLACKLRKIEYIVSGLATATYYFEGISTKVNRIALGGAIIASDPITFPVSYLGGTIKLTANKDGLEFEEGLGDFGSMPSDLTVEYFVKNTKENSINKCTFFGLFGGDNDTRVFLAGNPKAINTDYASGLFDASYFPDTSYTKIGDDSSAIIGYHKLYSNQIVIKDGAGADASQYLRRFAVDSSTKAYFPVKQGAHAEGAIGPRAFATVRSNPIYIGKNGVFSLAGTAIESESNTLSRSDLINKRLVLEDLSKAIAIGIDDKYYIAVNGQMYICDVANGFEWYYWNGLPEITCLWEDGNYLYFGTGDGRICRFLKPEEENAYYDDVGIGTDMTTAKAICAYWCTPQTTLDNWTHFKTIQNFYITCMPYQRSSVKVYYNTNEAQNEGVMTQNIDLFDFSKLDFERFTFNTVSAPFAFATGVRLKNIYVFGAKLQNDVPGEPFGFLSFAIGYRQGKIVK